MDISCIPVNSSYLGSLIDISILTLPIKMQDSYISAIHGYTPYFQ